MPVILIVEDGTGVSGANSFVTVQEAAQFYSERGGLIPLGDVSSAAVAFEAGGVITGAALADIPSSSIVEVRGAGETENSGFAYLRSNVAGRLTLDWLSTVVEAEGAIVQVTWFDQSGWWHASPARLLASLINAASLQRTRYLFDGTPVVASQALPWPRTGARTTSSSSAIDPSERALLIALDLGSTTLPGSYDIPSNVVPVGVKRCQLWLALADLDAPLQAPVDPQKYLVSSDIGPGGIKKTFGGAIRRRRFPHADAEVADLLGGESGAAPGGPFFSLLRV